MTFAWCRAEWKCQSGYSFRGIKTSKNVCSMLKLWHPWQWLYLEARSRQIYWHSPPWPAAISKTQPLIQTDADSVFPYSRLHTKSQDVCDFRAEIVFTWARLSVPKSTYICPMMSDCGCNSWFLFWLWPHKWKYQFRQAGRTWVSGSYEQGGTTFTGPAADTIQRVTSFASGAAEYTSQMPREELHVAPWWSGANIFTCFRG